VNAVAAILLILAQDGKTDYTIVTSPGATVSEKHAAAELASFLKQVTGATFPRSTSPPRGPAIYVGPGEHLKRLRLADDFAAYGPDELRILTRGRNLILAGGRPRGTLYAVYTFLEDVVGCRWWSSKVSTIPRKPTLEIKPLDRRWKPVFEYREPFYWDAFDGDWAARNKSNGNRPKLEDKHGGHITYQGFVHTFNQFVPPGKYFKEHPEWFGMYNGKRQRGGRTQLCITNDELKTFMAEVVVAQLKKNPKARIVSVSQNDWRNPCRCPKCVALAEKEGAESGPMLHFVNAVAEKVEKQYPHVAISTLAYQYTRKPPKFVRPRPNVIVRLCSIECDFAQPLGTGPTNRTFREDIEGWSKVSKRLYVWDYVTDFAHYIQPHPNLRVLGPNVRFFAANNVKGLFEQGAYQSPCGEMAELRAWVLAKLLWNPKLDDRKLIAEFVEGYYGDAAPHIAAYIKLIHDSVERTKHYLRIWSGPSAPFLTLDVLLTAEKLFDAAEKDVADQPDVLDRVKVARLPLKYVWIKRWRMLRAEARMRKLAWPHKGNRADLVKTFLAVARAHKTTKIREGASLEHFAKQMVDLPRREPAPPALVKDLPPEKWLDLQDDCFTLWRAGRATFLKKDPKASDGVAAWTASTHHEWAIQCRLANAGMGNEPKQRRVYVSVRCDATGREGQAFTYGLYDFRDRKFVASRSVSAASIKDADYHIYEVGTFPLHSGMYLWVAPAKNPKNTKGIWVDRYVLVEPAKQPR
jgi:uncharacterized protein DUF4838